MTLATVRVATARVRLPELARAGPTLVTGAAPAWSMVVELRTGLDLGKHLAGTSGAMPGDTCTLAVNCRPGFPKLVPATLVCTVLPGAPEAASDTCRAGNWKVVLLLLGLGFVLVSTPLAC